MTDTSQRMMDEPFRYSHEEQQIHDAFIDGYLTLAGNENRLPDAETAWREHNTTHRAST